MFAIKRPGLKQITLQFLLLSICLAFLLSACVTTNCGLQAAAGGAAYCEETSR